VAVLANLGARKALNRESRWLAERAPKLGVRLVHEGSSGPGQRIGAISDGGPSTHEL
jgi:hypothetical protein